MAKKDGTDPVVNRCMLVLGASLLCCINPAAVLARAPDPIPPQAVWMSDASALALLPDALLRRWGLQLLLHRSSRQLLVLDHGRLRLRVPAAVGTDEAIGDGSSRHFGGGKGGKSAGGDHQTGSADQEGFAHECMGLPRFCFRCRVW